MKKRISSIISLLLALLLLAGCGADSVSTVIVYERQPVQREMLRFEDIEYIRPELDSMYATADALLEALENPFKLNVAAQLLDSFLLECSNFDTMYMLAYIRSSMDVHDEFYDEEYGWCMESSAEKEMLLEELMEACRLSRHAPQLEQLFGEELSLLWNAEDAIEAGGSYEEYFALVERETELLNRYRDIVAEAGMDIDVSDMDYDEADAAYAAYYEKYNPVLAQLYTELIALHREIAEFMAYDSYAQLEYDMYERGYSPEESMEYMGHLKRYMAALEQEIQESGLREELIYDPVDERELELYLETVAWGFGGRIEEAWRFMKQYNMYDFSISADKAVTSFQTWLSDYNAPYLFLSPYGDTSDIGTLCHEFGHYVDDYIRQDAYENMDLAETYSQAMQLLSLDQLQCIMTGEEFESYSNMSMLDIFSSMVDQAILAEFEIRAHEMEAPTVEKLNALYLDILNDYGLCGLEDESYYSMLWVDVPHLFESPFYVISYVVSASAALELYEMELEEDGSGVESFITMSESGIATLIEAVEYAGLEDPLSENRVRQAAEFIRSRLPM